MIRDGADFFNNTKTFFFLFLNYLAARKEFNRTGNFYLVADWSTKSGQNDSFAFDVQVHLVLNFSGD
jgi:hypothetical protein